MVELQERSRMYSLNALGAREYQSKRRQPCGGHTVILLSVPVLAVGCLPTTPVEAGVGVAVIGFSCVLIGLVLSSALLKVEERKTAARFFLGAVS